MAKQFSKNLEYKENIMGFLSGKRALITGVLSSRSIGYGIAQAFHREGAELCFTYVNESFKERVIDLTAPFAPAGVFLCDVAKDDDITHLFDSVSQVWDGLDIVIHSIAYAPADQLGGDFIDHVNREGFRVAHDISVYSFCAMAKAARPLMKGRDGALLTLTYLGAERSVINYNTMGLAKASLEAAVRYTAQSLGAEGTRVNAISAGAIKTLAASGIKGFRKMLDYNAKTSPLKRNVTIEEVGNTAAFLCSPLASGITGEIVYVDAGFNTVGVALDFETE
jgi:enoyl-[acyl-carrier protein] reductase I